jgi:hypothetical protein
MLPGKPGREALQASTLLRKHATHEEILKNLPTDAETEKARADSQQLCGEAQLLHQQFKALFTALLTIPRE